MINIKSVEFKHTSNLPQYVTLNKLTSEDVSSITPEFFKNDFDEYPTMALTDFIGMIFPDGDTNKKPYFYIRHIDMKKHVFRFGNIVELGDDFLSPQKGVINVDKFAQGGVPVTPYGSFNDGTNFTGFQSDEPKSEFRFNENSYYVKEGDFFLLKGEHWPLAIREHKSMYNGNSTYIQAATHSGMLNGNFFVGVGEHDRLFVSDKLDGFDSISATLGYIYMNMIGIREDGRKEQVLISIDNSGKVLGYYYIDGETPIITDQVTMEADWYRLPYVDDGTCVYKDAVFKFCDKEFHFEGKWGSKGFTPSPRVEKHGQSQVFGTWYEGKKPYRHKVFMTLGENMEAYDYKLEKAGFNILDK